MQISLLEHFEVAERRGPSKRVANSSALKGGAVVQGCNSSLVYHFVMPEAARVIGSGVIARTGGHAPAHLSIGVTDSQGRRRTIVERSLVGESETIAFDKLLGSSWRSMMKLEFSIACEADDELRIHWKELRVAGTRPTPPATPLFARDRYNVLVILLDSLRADHIQPYGTKTIATPRLQALADEGVSFLNARSTASWTRAAVASLLTSQFALNHGVTGNMDRLPRNTPYLPDILQRNGYHTILITNTAMMSTSYGFDRGFTRVFSQFKLDLASGRRRYHDPAKNANEIWTKCIEPAVRMSERKPFFIYIHERDPHSPYDPPPPYDEMYASGYEGEAKSDLVHMGKLRTSTAAVDPALIERLDGLYSGEVSYMDRYVGTLLDRLERSKLDRKTLVVFISDHGEEFWDHESVGHGHTVYDELLKIPLIMRLKGVLPEGLATEVLIDLADVAPTILDVLGIDPPPQAQGSTVLPYVLADPSYATRDTNGSWGAHSRDHFSAAQAGSSKGTRTPLATSLVYQDWKLIHTPAGAAPARLSLFDLADDPGEREDIAAAHPVVVGTLDQMRRWMRREHDARQPKPEDSVSENSLDDATQQNLRALGYIE